MRGGVACFMTSKKGFTSFFLLLRLNKTILKQFKRVEGIICIVRA